MEQISQAVLLSLVVISSIALVGGIGVMAIMTISTERTREIGGGKRLERVSADSDPVSD